MSLADYNRIAALEWELGFHELPSTLEGVVARLMELDEEHVGEPLPDWAMAEWNVLCRRAAHLQELRELRRALT